MKKLQVEGLAKHLRCVGIDAAVPHLRKPDTRCISHKYFKMHFLEKAIEKTIVSFVT